MKRMLLLLAVAAMMAAMMVGSAGPVSAAKGGNGADVERVNEPEEGLTATFVDTPSGNSLRNAHLPSGENDIAHEFPKPSTVTQVVEPGSCVTHTNVTPSGKNPFFREGPSC